MQIRQKCLFSVNTYTKNKNNKIKKNKNKNKKKKIVSTSSKVTTRPSQIACTITTVICNMHANSVAHTQKFVHNIDSSVQILKVPISHTDHML